MLRPGARLAQLDIFCFSSPTLKLVFSFKLPEIRFKLVRHGVGEDVDVVIKPLQILLLDCPDAFHNFVGVDHRLGVGERVMVLVRWA